MPVKNFSPELLKVFEAGSKKAFEFDCQTEKDAFRLRWRLNALRREMRKERHWLTPVAEAVVISVKGTKLIARPPDTDIAEARKHKRGDPKPRYPVHLVTRLTLFEELRKL